MQTVVKNLATKNGDTVTLTAEFEPNTYKASITTSHVTISLTENGVFDTKLENLSLTTAQVGGLVIYAKPDTGYHFNISNMLVSIIKTQVKGDVVIKTEETSTTGVYKITFTNFLNAFTAEISAVVNNYTINFDLDGGAFDSAFAATLINGKINATYNASYSINKPVKDGYTFTGWTISNFTNTATITGYQTVDETTKYGASADKITVSNLTSVNNGEVTLTATWEANKYDVTFDLDGGKINNSTDDVVINTEFDELFEMSEPTKVGYIFKGWYTTDSIYSGAEAGGKAWSQSLITFEGKQLVKAANFKNLSTDADIEFIAIWAADEVDFTVNIYVQKETYNAASLNTGFDFVKTLTMQALSDSSLPSGFENTILQSELSVYGNNLEYDNTNGTSLTGVTIAPDGSQL